MDEGLDPILIQVTVPLPVPMIYSALTDGARVANWLCERAQVEPKVGGAYHLAWDGPPAFESHGAVTRMTPEVDLGYSWQSPPEFEELMNGPPLKTEVYIRLQESPEGVDITLEHTGWGSSTEWEEARSWHFHFWDERLRRLKDFLIRDAYG